jgi:hypothetical protein
MVRRRDRAQSRRTLAFRLVVLLVLVFIGVAPGSGGGEVRRVLYLDVYGYANNLSYYKSGAPDNRWAGYRIRSDQNNGNQVTTNPNYDDYHFATDCDYDRRSPPGFVDINGQGAFVVFSETGNLLVAGRSGGVGRRVRCRALHLQSVRGKSPA